MSDVSKKSIIELGKKLKKQVVVVTWHDAEQIDDISIAGAMGVEMSTFETIGYLIKQDKEKIILCFNYCESDPASKENDIFIIPRKMIKEITELK